MKCTIKVPDTSTATNPAALQQILDPFIHDNDKSTITNSRKPIIAQPGRFAIQEP